MCAELRHMPKISRAMLKGDYLFIIDNNPLFILLVDDQEVWSVFLKSKNPPSEIESTDFDIEVDAHCPFKFNKDQINEIIENSARCQIRTDGNTLKRLLLGNLKARVAFITQRVKISGDFPAFLKIISYLKTKGVKATHGNTES